ncbi:MAG TPA: PAS domain S-box protein [Melioribacteraceae bacterium]|nr:PAS domain S-box protein [Melioribacteraceae bacterium]
MANGNRLDNNNLIAVPSRIALIYFIISFLWIFFSDKFIEQFFPDAATLSTFQTVKGLFFIGITSIIIYILIHRDVVSIQKQKMLFQSIVETSPVGITLLNEKGEFTFANREASELFGLSKKEIESRKYDSPEWIIRSLDGHPIQPEELPFYVVKRTKSPVRNVEFTIESPGKKKIYLSLNASPIYTEKSKFSGVVASISDVTKQKLYEEELNEKDLLLEETGRIAKVGGWEFDAVTLKGTWTDEVARIHDLDPSLPTNVELGVSFYTEDSRAKIEAAIKEALENGKPYDLELEMLTANNVNKWVRTIGQPVIKNNKVVKVKGSFQDITETKRAAERLKESQTFIQKITDTIPLAIYIYDIIEDRNIYTNKNIFEKLGYTPEEILQMGSNLFPSLLHPDDFKKLSQNIKRYENAQENDVLELEYRMKDKKGKFRWLHSWDVIFSRTADGKPKQILGVVEDISAKKEMQIKLAESQTQYQNLFENAPDAVFINFDDEIVLVNREFQNLMRAGEKDQLIGLSPFDIFHHDFHDNIRQRILTMRETGRPVLPIEEKIVCLDGTEIDVEVSAAPFPLHGGNAIHVILRDISDRKKSEEELQRYHNQLELLTRHLQTAREEERESIAREIHDDFGQVLTSMKMNLTFLKRNINSRNKAGEHYDLLNDIDSMAGIIDRSVIKLRKLITALRPEVLDKLGLITALEWQTEEFKKETRIECSFSTDVKELKLDKNMEISLFRILQESLNNIAKHSRASKVEVRFNRDKPGYILEITDNGIGMAKDSLTRNTYGIIGMRERAKLIKGELSISSEQNRGTKIKLFVPEL